MILLVTTSSRGKECAAALEQGTGHKTFVANTVPQALHRLHTAEYDAIIVDQFLVDGDLSGLNSLLNRCGMAMPVYINLALNSAERLVREVQVALRRIDSERLLAMSSAQKILSDQLRGNLTGILLSSELALRQGAIAPEVAEKVRSVRDLAEKMRTQLGNN
jgi:CheY-like chemotaxis protein